MRGFVLMILMLPLAACDAVGDAGREAALKQFENTGVEIETDANFTGAGIEFLEPDGTAQYMRFGADRSEVERLAAARWGQPTETGSSAECPAGPIEFAKYGEQRHGLNYQNGKFVGWMANPDTSSLLPITRQMVQRESGFAMVESSTLGQEFVFDRDGAAVSGLLVDDRPNAKVEAMWAGTNCIFR